jgi:hypothetical protein
LENALAIARSAGALKARTLNIKPHWPGAR